MYEELVRDLRENHDKYFARDMEAADAIVELSRKARELPPEGGKLMYDELVKRLREFASIPEHCENVADCDECSKEEICLSFTNKRIIEVATQAADAIEELFRVAEVNVKRAMKWAYDAEKAEEKIRWIPVTERPPEKNEDVLCFTSENEMFIATYIGVMGGDIVFDDGEGSAWLGDITHWMKRPKPPSEVQA